MALTEANAALDAKLHEAQAAASRAQLTQARWVGGWVRREEGAGRVWGGRCGGLT